MLASTNQTGSKKMSLKYYDLNIEFYGDGTPELFDNQILDNGVILGCGWWELDKIKEWAPNLDYYAIIYIRDNWLNNPQACAEGLGVKITW